MKALEKISSPMKEKEGGEEDKDERTESAKSTVSFPVLEPVEKGNDPAMRCGDWLTTVATKAATFGNSAAEYWTTVVKDAEDLYHQYVKASPLEKLEIKFTKLNEEVKMKRIRAEFTSKLLESIPEDIKRKVFRRRSYIRRS